MEFEERLNFLLQDRKRTPWGKTLGFTSTSISSMFNGHVPGPEFLQAIRRAENVNLNWLLTGDGSVYISEYYQSGLSLSKHVSDMLEEEPWKVYVCSHRDVACMVLTQPGQYEFKGKWIDYTIVNVLSGPCDESLGEVLRNHHKGHGKVLVIDKIDPLVPHIASGDFGTYDLLEKQEPILNEVFVGPDISDIEFSNSSKIENSIDISVMRAVVKLVDECEHKLNVKLNSTQRARVITAVYRQAERLDLDERDIQNAVETSLEVLMD